jgi:hypothetical protein
MNPLRALLLLGLAARYAEAGVSMASGDLTPVTQVGQPIPFILGRADRWLCWVSAPSGGVLGDTACGFVGTATTVGSSSTVRCGAELSAGGNYPIEWDDAARVVINVRQCKVQGGNQKRNDGGALTISVTQGAATVVSLTTPSVVVTLGPTTLHFVTRGLDATMRAFYKIIPAAANCGDVSGTADAIEGGHGELTPDGTTGIACCPSTKAGTVAITLTQIAAYSAANVCQSSAASGVPYIALSGGADTVHITVSQMAWGGVTPSDVRTTIIPSTLAIVVTPAVVPIASGDTLTIVADHGVWASNTVVCAATNSVLAAVAVQGAVVSTTNVNLDTLVITMDASSPVGDQLVFACTGGLAANGASGETVTFRAVATGDATPIGPGLLGCAIH